MPVKQEYVVRVVLFDLQLRGQEGALLECFRYAGLISTPRDGTHPEDPNLPTLTFDIRCPQGLQSKPWSEMNAARMRTFGFNAQSAPKA